MTFLKIIITVFSLCTLFLTGCSSDSSSTPATTDTEAEASSQISLTGTWDVTETTTGLTANCAGSTAFALGDVVTYTLIINQLMTENVNGFVLELDDGVNVFTNTNADGLIEGNTIGLGYVYDIAGGGGQIFVNGVGLTATTSGDAFEGSLIQEVFNTVLIPPAVTCTKTVDFVAFRQGAA